MEKDRAEDIERCLPLFVLWAEDWDEEGLPVISQADPLACLQIAQQLLMSSFATRYVLDRL